MKAAKFSMAKGYAPKVIALPEVSGGPLRLELERGLSASGRVVDEEGNPIPGARLIVWMPSTHQIGSSVGTDGTGAFELEDLARDVILWVHLRDRANSTEVRDIAGKMNETIVIERRIPLAGRVIDGESGEPIPQFRIRLDFSRARPEGRTNLGIASNHLNPGLLFDAEDGSFRFGEFVPNSAVALFVSAEGYTTREVDPVVIGTDVQPIALVPATGAARLWKGVVRDEEGDAVHNARLVLIPHREGESQLDLPPSHFEVFLENARTQRPSSQTTSGRDGAFDLGKLELPNDGTLVVESDRHVRKLMIVGDDSPELLEIIVSAGASVRVSVNRRVYPTVHGVHIVPEEDTVNSLVIMRSLESNEGVVEITGLKPGGHILQLQASGIPDTNARHSLPGAIGHPTRGLTTAWKTVELKAEEKAEVLFDGANSFTVSGNIIDRGQPWSGRGTVLLERLQKEIQSGTRRHDRYTASHEVQPEADGTFTIPNVQAGRYRAKLVDGFDHYRNTDIGGSRPFEVTGRTTGIVVQRWRTPALVGSVADWNPDMNPESLYCIVRRVNETGGSDWAAPFKVDEKGAFRIENLSPGHYQLEIMRQNGGWNPPVDVEVPVSGAGEIDIGAVTLPKK